jgi:hypothetical protein
VPPYLALWACAVSIIRCVAATDLGKLASSLRSVPKANVRSTVPLQLRRGRKETTNKREGGRMEQFPSQAGLSEAQNLPSWLGKSAPEAAEELRRWICFPPTGAQENCHSRTGDRSLSMSGWAPVVSMCRVDRAGLLGSVHSRTTGLGLSARVKLNGVGDSGRGIFRRL